MSRSHGESLYGRSLSLAGIDSYSIPDEDLTSLFRKILDGKIHGLSFSPYVTGQGPGTRIDAPQIVDRMNIIRPYVNWVRSFSCTDGNELIPRIAHENGLKTMVGVWLEGDHDKNEQELENAIEVARAGHADILAVGNEVLLRGDLEGEGEAGVVLARFDGVDRLTRHLELLCEPGLRPVALGPHHLEPVFHA